MIFKNSNHYIHTNSYILDEILYKLINLREERRRRLKSKLSLQEKFEENYNKIRKTKNC